jgi:hypothetical protein
VSATVNFTNVNCFGGSNGEIVVSSISGGEGSPYYVKLNSGGTYQLTTTTRTYSNLTPGNYVVYVSDFNNNVTTYNVTITQPTQQSASITVNTATTCGNFNDGVITIGSTGGTWPKTYRLYADTTSPYESCGGDLINTWTNIGAGSPTVVVSNLYAYGYCLEVTDANGCITNSGVVETTGCIGTCYEISIPVSSTSNNGETLYIEYRKTDNVYVSQPYTSFPQSPAIDNNIVINICSIIGVSFKYGVSGYQFISEGFITVTSGGKCDNSEWCGGADPYIPPPPTLTPPPTEYPYYCNYGSGCVGQNEPCPNYAIDCGFGPPGEQV